MEKSQADTAVADLAKGGIQQKIYRLHSFLFGIDAACSRGDSETALGLGLRLLGFLESECKSIEDVTYIEPIKRQVLKKIATASQETQVDRLALEEARAASDFKFRQGKTIDVERIENEAFYRAFVQRSKPEDNAAHSTTKDISNNLVPETKNSTADVPHRDGVLDLGEEVNGFRSSKAPAQSRLTSLYTHAHQKVAETVLKDPDFLGVAPKAKYSAATLPSAGSYRRRATENRDNDRLPSPESEAKINPYSLNRKRPNNPYGAKRKPEKFKKASREVPKEVAREEMSSDDDSPSEPPSVSFVTAKQKLALDLAKKNGATPASNSYQSGPSTSFASRPPGKTLGMSRRGVRGSFIPPIRGANAPSAGAAVGAVSMPRGPSADNTATEDSTRKCMEMLAGPDGELPDKLKNLEPRLLEHVSNEIMDQDPNVRWDDIAGLEHAKKCVTEMVIYPLDRKSVV